MVAGVFVWCLFFWFGFILFFIAWLEKGKVYEKQGECGLVGHNMTRKNSSEIFNSGMVDRSLEGGGGEK